MTISRFTAFFAAIFITGMLALGASVSPASAGAPLGYQLMCLKTPSECRGGGSAKQRLNSDELSTLKKVNTSVNRKIKPRYDGDVDVWSANATSGDCEDYVLAKRRALIKAGFSASALRIAYVKTRSGQDHAVLVVKTNKGDLVLDNLTNQVKPLSQSGLRVVSMSG